MNNTGIVRKIDELGRIVIPKEIRTTLNIKNGESLEINVVNDEIILKKFYKIKSTLENINVHLKIFDILLDSNFIVTDREKIVATSSKLNNLKNTKINQELSSIIELRKQVIEKSKVKVKFFEDIEIEGAYIIVPIIIDTDLIGSIICFKNTTLLDTDILSINILNYILKNNYFM